MTTTTPPLVQPSAEDEFSTLLEKNIEIVRVLSENNEGYESEIESLQALIKASTKTVATYLETRVENLETEVGTLTTRMGNLVGTLTTRMGNLETEMNTQERTLTTEIENLKSQVEYWFAHQPIQEAHSIAEQTVEVAVETRTLDEIDDAKMLRIQIDQLRESLVEHKKEQRETHRLTLELAATFEKVERAWAPYLREIGN